MILMSSQIFHQFMMLSARKSGVMTNPCDREYNKSILHHMAYFRPWLIKDRLTTEASLRQANKELATACCGNYSKHHSDSLYPEATIAITICVVRQSKDNKIVYYIST